MKIKKLIALLIVAPCSSLLTSRPVYGFNIIYRQPPYSLSYSNLAYYKTNVGNEAILTRDNLVKLTTPSTKSEFWRVLTSSFSSGWDFRRNGTPVYGDFLIDQYKVCPPFSVCSDLSASGTVGAFLDLAYKENITFGHNQRYLSSS